MGENVVYTYMHINHVEELKPGDTFEAFKRRVEDKYRREPVVAMEAAQGQPQVVAAPPPVEVAGEATAEPVVVAEPDATEPDFAPSPESSPFGSHRRPGRPRKS